MPENGAISQQNAPHGKGRDIVDLLAKESLQMVFWTPDDGMNTVHQWITSSALFVKILLDKQATHENGLPKNPQNLATRFVDDLQARAEMGKKKYGERLRAFNGRNALLDLYQELLDACNYSRQFKEERDTTELS